MQTILITGGTGMIGSALSKLLIANGYSVIILTRKIETAPSGIRHPVSGIQYAQWNISQQTIDEAAIRKADHIIHLAGANIAEKRWTNKRKKEIRDSRTQSSALLVKALKEIPNKVRTVVSASAIGWYGEDPSIPNPRPFNEENPAAPGFLGDTCKAWEDSIEPVTGLDKRLVKLRTGIVLSNEGGAFREFNKPLNFGMATILGSGKQIISWIHISDLCRLYLYALEHQQLNGAINAVAPFPISNKALVLEMAKKLRGKFFVPVYVPVFALKLLLGEMSIEILKSTTVSSNKIRQTGFQFIYPSIETAVRDLTR